MPAKDHETAASRRASPSPARAHGPALLVALVLALGATACRAPGSGSATASDAAAHRPEPEPARVPRQSEAGPGEPAGEPRARPLTVAVVSDLNGAYGSTLYGEAVVAAMSRIEALRPDLVLCTGDMVAGQRAGLDYPAMWAAFHAAVTDRLARAGIPLAVTPGNHDGSGSGSRAEERAVFEAEWASRRPALSFVDGSAFPSRYAFELGPALFVALDASRVGPLGAGQRAWLASRLEAGRDRPARIVFGHLPIHPVAVGRQREVLGDPALERLLADHAALYLSGHHHAYYPARRGALRLVAVGRLGSGPRALLGEGELPAPPSFVVLEVAADGRVSVSALEGPRFDRPVALEALPRAIGEGEGRLSREDR